MSEPKMIKIESHKRTDPQGFTYEPPPRCSGCDRDLRAKEWPEGGNGPYLQINLPIPGICIYQCLKCNTVMGNVHSMNNMKILQAIQEAPRIMRPSGGSLIKMAS